MASQSRQRHRQSRRNRHPGKPGRPVRPSISAMTPGELRTWIVVTRAAFQKKLARERAYLDRRAARGTYTPTDEAYEAHQRLEADIVALLDEFEQHLVGRRDEPPSSGKRRS
jgi:hypothetical protein